MRVRLHIGVIAVSVVACVEQAPREVGGGPDGVEDGVASDSQAEVSSDVEGQACREASECVGPTGECERWACVGGGCEVAGLSDVACGEAGDVCAVGVCEEGVCVTTELLCGSDDPCLRPRCDMDLGCVREAEVGGFCHGEESGGGWGTCVGPLMQAVSRCDAAGVCVGGGVGGGLGVDPSVLGGEWFVMRHWVGADGVASTRVGVMGFDVVDGVTTVQERGFEERDVQAVGAWCLDAHQGFSLNLPGVGLFLGQVTAPAPGGRRADGLVAHALGGNALVVGVRGGAGARGLDGDYRAVWYVDDLGVGKEALVGGVSFDEGCLVAPTVLRARAVEGDVALGGEGGGCLEQTPEGSPLELVGGGLRLVPGGGPELSARFVGAVSSEGDFAVLSARRDTGEVIPGVLVLVREAMVAGQQGDGLERWFVAGHGRREVFGEVRTDGYRGMWLVQDGELRNGILERARSAGGGEVVSRAHVLGGTVQSLPRSARFLVRARVSDGDAVTAGAVSRSGFGFAVETDAGARLPSDAPLRASRAGLGLFVRSGAVVSAN